MRSTCACASSSTSCSTRSATTSALKVVIMTGEGRGFSAGGDLKSEAGALGAPRGVRHGQLRPLQGTRPLLLQRPAPRRAAARVPQARGPAADHHRGDQRPGGRHRAGNRAPLCDLRYASDKAKLGEVAVPAGFLPESGGARNLPKLVGVGKAMEMILTGRHHRRGGGRAHRPRRARGARTTTLMDEVHGARRPDRVRTPTSRCATPRSW